MDGLKQRIIGALVLVSLAVIFVPMLFDEPHSERTSRSINIPEEPPFPEVDAPEPPAADAPAYRLEESGEPEPDAQRQVQRVDEPAEPVSEAQPEPAPQTEPAEPVAQESAAQEPAPTPEPENQQSDQQADSAEYAGSLEGAWVVQLGSFGSADNARNLRNKVRDQGYNSHLQEIQRGDTTLTRVFSGPFAEKAEAERAKRALDREFGLNSLVTSGGK
ncbi:sporulation protein [Marinobacter sp. NP-4(2019)]|uniref:SPOR domain-containing protein n=1 Tax=Marinobacter sp. NP-4(2019) TaxID=2488665 RepID=UPI000FC3EFC8|nr:SPOR domain-containing protein [Marinobacter sp. NP-4(2019)]AZT84031.1 sporulation protein [Marinobacter sp. NP-4(2019)]